MVTIVTKNSLSEVFHPDKEFLLIPIFQDFNKHPLANKLLAIGLLCLDDNQKYLIPIESIDVLENIPLETIPFSESKKIWTPSANSVRHLIPAKLFDIQTIEFYYSDTISDPSKFYLSQMKQADFSRFNNAAMLVPILLWCDYCEEAFKHWSGYIHEYLPKNFDFQNDITLPTLFEIEKSGIKVDVNLFKQHYPQSDIIDKDGFVHTQYNPHTIAGRITNKFGGVNFSAFNKTDGSRQSIISRYDGGKLIAFDYQAFHVRLIANILGTELPLNVHEYFTEKYYGKITPELYDSSKQKTFQYLYSGDDSSGLQFFKDSKQLMNVIWKEFTENGRIESPLSRREIKFDSVWEPSPPKIFNYFIQMIEMENSIYHIHNALKRLSDGSKPIMYIYDSIIFDTPNGLENIREIKHDLEGGLYPTNVYEGPNYQDLKIRKL